MHQRATTRTRPRKLGDALCGWLAAMLAVQPLFAGAALAKPRDAQVVRGEVEIVDHGDHVVIHASDGSVINFRGGMDVALHETLEFIQPHELARALAQILDGRPTEILGTLLANGQLYIVNPAGMIFGPDAVVDVARLVAAGGGIDVDDFVAGIDRFTGVEGDVVNHGQIDAGVVQLIGRHVANHGVIGAEGLIMLVAGSEVFLGRPGERGLVRMDLGALVDDATAAVENSGTLEAGDGHVVLAAGDFASLAIRHSGATTARSIVLEGGEGGVVEVAGSLDASDRSAGATGGRIAVLGDKVAVLDADLDASGDAGGGEILVGGDFQGRGEVPTASRTYVGADAQLRADAESEGDGGKVIVWADEVTGFYGDISATGGAGGGDGGFAEVSGKGALIYRGQSNLSAPAGETGTLLLDPTTIDIAGGNGDGADVDGNEGTFAGDVNMNPGEILNTDFVAAPVTVYETEIEGQSALNNIVLEATDAITVSGVFANNDVAIQGGNSLSMRTTNAAGAGIDLATGVSNDLAFTTTGAGTISLESAAGLTVGRLVSQNGNVTLTAGGDVRLNEIQSGGTVGIATTAGSIEELVADGDVDVTAAVFGARATTGIGAADPIETQVATLAAETGEGAIRIANTGDVAIGTVAVEGSDVVGVQITDTNATADGAGIELTAASLLTVGQVVTNADGGDVELAADDMAINAAVSGASATLRPVTPGRTIDLGTNTPGSLGLTDAEIDQVTATTALQVGDAAAGTLTVSAPITRAGTAQLRLATGGAIVDGNAAAGADLTAATLDLQAATGIGAADPLELAGATAIAADTTDGDIDLDHDATGTGGTTVSSLTTGTGTISFGQTGDETLAVTTATTDDGAIELENTGNDLSVGTVTAGGAARNVTLRTVNAGDVQIGAVTALDDQVTVDSAGAIDDAQADALADITAGTIDLDAETGIGASEALELAGATGISADTTDGDIDLDHDATGTGGTTVSSLTTGTGAITFGQTGDQTLVVTTATTDDGAIELENTGNDLAVGTVTAGGAARNVTLRTLNAGDVTLGAVTAADDQVTVDSAGAIDDAQADALADITAGTIDLDAETGIGASEALELAGATGISADTTDGNIDLDHDSAVAAGDTTVSSLTTGTGAIAFEQAGDKALTVATATTDTGPIELRNTGGDVRLGVVTATGDMVTVDASGAIEDLAADDAPDITAATIDLDAGTGIGVADPLELAGATAIAADTTDGDIDLDHDATGTGGTTVSSLTTGTGAITFGQTGNETLVVTTATTDDGAIELENTGNDLSVGTVTAGGAARNVTLRTVNAGDVQIGAVTALDDQVTVDSAAGIRDAQDDDVADITADVVDLDAPAGIGTVTQALELAGASMIAADAVSDGVNVTHAAAGATTLTSLSAVGGTVRFAQTGNQALTVELATGGSDDLRIENTGGANADITIDRIAATGLVTLRAEGGLEENPDPEVDIEALQLALDVTGDVGAADPLETAVAEIAAEVGSLDLVNNQDLRITTNLDGLSGIQTTTGDLVIEVNSKLTVAGAVSAAGTARLDAAGDGTLDPIAILFEGVEGLSAGANVELNTKNAPPEIPQLATIARVDDNGDLTLEAGNDLVIGQPTPGIGSGQKVSGPGTVTLKAGGEVVTGDVSGVKVVIDASKAVFVTRDGGEVKRADGVVVADQAMDIVGNTIVLPANVEVLGGGALIFATANGNPSTDVTNPPAGALFTTIFPTPGEVVAGDLFSIDDEVLDLVAEGTISCPGGQVCIQVPPVPEEAMMRTGVLSGLNQAAVSSKPLWASEVIDVLECSLWEDEDPEDIPEEYARCAEVLAKEESDPRLQTEPAQAARNGYRDLFSEADALRDVLQKAADDYRASAPPDRISGEGFRSFVEEQAVHLDALGYLTRLDELFRNIDALGGGAAALELDEWRLLLLDDIAPAGLSPEELDDAIRAGKDRNGPKRAQGQLFASDGLPRALR